MDLVNVETEEEGICIQMEILRRGKKHRDFSLYNRLTVSHLKAWPYLEPLQACKKQAQIITRSG
jgi:hypothetical protein